MTLKALATHAAAQEFLKEHFPTHTIHSCKLDARMLGCPMSRVRMYRLLLKNDRFFWSCAHTFDELAEKILLNRANTGPLTADDFFVAGPTDVAAALNTHVARNMNFEAKLSNLEKGFLATYRASYPDRKVYDLSQNPATRARTSLQDGGLCCLTTSNKLWGEKAGRWLVGKELLNAVGVPVMAESAQTARVDKASIQRVHLSEHALTTMCGNSMHVPCVGFAILVAALCIEARPTDVL